MGVVTRRIEDAFELCMFLVICHENRHQPFSSLLAVQDKPDKPVVIMSEGDLAEGHCDKTGLTIRKVVHPRLDLGPDLPVTKEMVGHGVMSKCPVATLFYIEDSIARLRLKDNLSVVQFDDVFQIRGTVRTHNENARVFVDIPIGLDQDGNTWRLERRQETE